MPAPGQHPAVDAELQEAARWYDARCQGMGDQFIDAVRAAVRGAARAPMRYAIRFVDVRRVLLKRFPYSVWYFPQGDRIFVLSVMHESQRDSISQPGVARHELRRVRSSSPFNPERVEPPRPLRHPLSMPQSLAKILLHVVFSTKERRPLLRNHVFREEMHRYIGGILSGQDCPAIIVGGVEDHVHLLCVLSRTCAPADMVKEVKRSSSLWIKTRAPEFGDFAWQSGYGVFSIGQSHYTETNFFQCSSETMAIPLPDSRGSTARSIFRP